MEDALRRSGSAPPSCSARASQWAQFAAGVPWPSSTSRHHPHHGPRYVPLLKRVFHVAGSVVSSSDRGELMSNGGPLPLSHPNPGGEFAADLRGLDRSAFSRFSEPLGELVVLPLERHSRGCCGPVVAHGRGARSATFGPSTGQRVPSAFVFGAAFKLLMKAIVKPLLGAAPINPTITPCRQPGGAPGNPLRDDRRAGFGEETVFRGYLFRTPRQAPGNGRGRQT